MPKIFIQNRNQRHAGRKECRRAASPAAPFLGHGLGRRTPQGTGCARVSHGVGHGGYARKVWLEHHVNRNRWDSHVSRELMNLTRGIGRIHNAEMICHRFSAGPLISKDPNPHASGPKQTCVPVWKTASKDRHRWPLCEGPRAVCWDYPVSSRLSTW